MKKIPSFVSLVCGGWLAGGMLIIPESGAAQPASAPNVAAAPAFSEKAVSLATTGGVLYGSELVPAGKGPWPVVLLHAGSGPTDRDGNSRMLPGKNNSLKQLAEGLARQGVASVRFDKRGIGQSAAAGAAESELRFDNYVDDAAAWLKPLRADARFGRVIIAGHSEGSLIGMLAAAKAGADGYVSIAGIARAADDVLRDQLRPQVPPAVYADADRVLIELKAGKTVANPPAQLTSLFRPAIQPYLMSWFKYTPAEIIKTLKMPVLVVQGSSDVQVAVSEAKSLSAAAPGSTLVVVDGMNHVLKMVGLNADKQRSSYSDPEMQVSEEMVTAIAEFSKAAKSGPATAAGAAQK